MNSDDVVKRVTPQSGLDFNMMLTDTMWGSQQISSQLMEKVRQRGKEQDEKAAPWELLSFYTRDLRLANLSQAFGEMEKCEHCINLAADCLREGYMEAFSTAISRAATVLELSQSKGGFLRRRQNTLTMENFQGEQEGKKKSLLFGMKTKR